MIYLDNQATTPLAPEAREAMLPWLAGPDSSGFANPHSPHRPGRLAAAAVEIARAKVAALLPPGGRVVFTSGATEALNLAILGSGRKRLAVSAIEHAAVLETVQFADPGCAILPVDRDGLVDAEAELHVVGVGQHRYADHESGEVRRAERRKDRGSRGCLCRRALCPSTSGDRRRGTRCRRRCGTRRS